MKGFIEVTRAGDCKLLLNMQWISEVTEEEIVEWNTHALIHLRDTDHETREYCVQETYDEIKALIEAAQKEDEPSFVITSNKCGFEMPDGTFRGFRNEETQQ
jgi:hypothetical protein